MIADPTMASALTRLSWEIEKHRRQLQVLEQNQGTVTFAQHPRLRRGLRHRLVELTQLRRRLFLEVPPPPNREQWS